MTERQYTLFQPNETHTCAYLSDQQSRSLYVDPNTELNQHDLSLLSYNGFRRSGRLVYRPNCPNCNACQSVRIISAQFQPNKSHKRILHKNLDLTLSVCTPRSSSEIYQLYQRYIDQRHANGDMYPASVRQFDDFLCSDYGNTGFLLAHHQQQLLACMVFDVLDDGLSAVYCFFAPEEQRRSLGSLMLIRLTQLSHALHLPYNYLGYYIKNSDKMSYKRHFQPLEVFKDRQWCASIQ